MGKVLLFLSFIFLIIYSGYTTWALNVHEEIDIYQEERIRLRDEKIMNLEYNVAECQYAQNLRCNSADSSVLRD